MAEPADPLGDLRARVRETTEAAERLVREGVPPRGWEGSSPATGLSDEVNALAQLLAALRDLLPPELREQINELVRQVLIVIRALIDFLVERMEERPRGAAPEVEDIPIA